MLRLAALVLALSCAAAGAAEQLPDKPARFFNDSTGVVDRNVADQLNERLADYERESSNQLVVAFYPRMVTDSSLEDYCTRTFEKWGVGGAKRDNGAVLFVFKEQNKMRIQTGYGLEASLTDAECFRIIEGIKPFFRAGDYTGGARFAVDSMIEATKGEYQGTGRTLAEEEDSDPQLWIALGFFALMIGFRIYQARKRGYVYDSRGGRHLAGGRGWYDSGWSGGSGGGFGGGGRGGGGGSTFSGGGGSTGGGGASGGW